MAVFFLFTIINNYQLLFIGTEWDLSLTITPQTVDGLGVWLFELLGNADSLMVYKCGDKNNLCTNEGLKVRWLLK